MSWCFDAKGALLDRSEGLLRRLSTLGVVLLGVAFLLPFLLPDPTRERTSEDTFLAARLAQSLGEELRALPMGAEGVRVTPGAPSTTYRREASPEQPLFSEWTVEALRYRPGDGSWDVVPGGETFEALRIAIQVRGPSRGASGSASRQKDGPLGISSAGPVLARLTVYRAAGRLS